MNRPAGHATTEAIGQYVNCVFEPSDIVEVRLLPKGTSTWYPARELAAQAAVLGRHNSAGKNVYVGANPRTRRGGAKGADVALARCLFVDFDGPTPGKAEEILNRVGLPQPTLLISSGHGTHAYWRLIEPLTDLTLWSRITANCQRGTVYLASRTADQLLDVDHVTTARWLRGLEALGPDQLQKLLRQAIESVVDRAAYQQEIDAEKSDLAWLAEQRQRVQLAVNGIDKEGSSHE